MKVSSKIIAGFLTVMLLALVVIGYQLFAIGQMQHVNSDLSEINLKSATTVVEMQRLADLLGEDSKKYFGLFVPDPGYDKQIAEIRSDFIDDLNRLRQTVTSPREQLEIVRLREALDGYWLVFNRLKAENAWNRDELPPDLTLAVNHLQARSEIMLDAVQTVIRERAAAAATVVGDRNILAAARRDCCRLHRAIDQRTFAPVDAGYACDRQR
jgi:hypothetical protein